MLNFIPVKYFVILANHKSLNPTRCLLITGIALILLLSASPTCLFRGEHFYQRKYRHHLDPSCTFITAGANYTVERTADAHFVRKTYHYDTAAKIREDWYADSSLSIRDGAALRWSDAGFKWKESHYRNGKKDGPWKHYYPLDGRLLESQYYTNDTLNGLWIITDTLHGGLLDSGLYVMGRKEGCWTTKYLHFASKVEIWYRSGVEHGPYRFYENDSIVREYWMENGKNITNSDRIYEMFDIQPLYRFPGGEKGLAIYWQKEINPPEVSRQTGITDTAYFLLNFRRDGQIAGVQTINGLSRTIQKVCLDAINRMPFWLPPEMAGVLRDRSMLLAIPIDRHEHSGSNKQRP